MSRQVQAAYLHPAEERQTHTHTSAHTHTHRVKTALSFKARLVCPSLTKGTNIFKHEDNQSLVSLVAATY